MKYSKQILSCMLAMGLLSACSNTTKNVVDNTDHSTEKHEQTEKSKAEETTSGESTNTKTNQTKDNQKAAADNQTTNSVGNSQKVNNQADVIASIKKELKTNLPVLLPSQLPIKEGQYLTATTKIEKNNYTIVFYESKKKVPVNDSSLKTNTLEKSIVAKYSVVEYNSLEKANEVIGFQDFSKAGGQKVNLGHNIIGYQDAGAGALWTSWNEGRWALATHTRTPKPELGLELAKQAVNFLEKNTLPIPKPNGSIRLDAITSTENNVKWQNNNIVYSIEKVKNPLDALKIATSMK